MRFAQAQGVAMPKSRMSISVFLAKVSAIYRH